MDEKVSKGVELGKSHASDEGVEVLTRGECFEGAWARCGVRCGAPYRTTSPQDHDLFSFIRLGMKPNPPTDRSVERHFGQRSSTKINRSSSSYAHHFSSYMALSLHDQYEHRKTAQTECVYRHICVCPSKSQSVPTSIAMPSFPDLSLSLCPKCVSSLSPS